MKTLRLVHCLFVSVCCLAFATASSQTPTISSFAPTSGPIGTVVTITGTNFSTTQTDNVVYFGATKATVSAATTTSLTVAVPVGATFKPISVAVGGLMAYSAKPFVVTFTSGWPSDVVVFDTKVDFSIGSNSDGIVLQDFDGDGKADVAAIDVVSNVVSVFKNVGSAGGITASTFAAKVDFPTGGYARSLVAGDFDGDGRIDLAWTKGADVLKVGVLRNTSTPGNISFAAYTHHSSAWVFRRLTTGDVDGDGRCELIGDNDGG
ncbi:MAG: VCBS repeat-containing protein, partial [Ignavibacteriae bacterium]|nr:VCBS repeat-containing protein [Ignavibacteriota bacterium]